MRRPLEALECPKCMGRGQDDDGEACTRCSGKGWVMPLSISSTPLGGARLFRNPLIPDQELLSLIERLKDHVMTPGERHAQRRSWVIGELMLTHPEMTRDEAAQLVDQTIADVQWRGIHKLTEEIGELGQVIGKLGEFPSGNHPDGGPQLRQRLEEELADVEAAILYFP